MLSSLLSLTRRLPSHTRLLSTLGFQDWKNRYFISGHRIDLEVWLVSNIGSFYDEEVAEVLRAYKKHEYTTMDPALAIALEKEIEARVNTDFRKNWKLLYSAAKIYRQMMKAGVDVVPLAMQMASKHLTFDSFESGLLPHAALVLSTFSKLHNESRGIKPKFTLANGDDVFEVAKVTLPARFKNYKEDDFGYWFMILSSAISQNWGSEEFLRSLEQKLLPDLNKLPVLTFIDLPIAYAHRKCDDYHYLQETYQRPYHRKLEQMVGNIAPHFLAQAIRNLSAPQHHPFYCDEQFAVFMNRVLRDRMWLQGHDSILEVTSSSLQLAARLGFTTPVGLLDQIRYNLVICSHNMTLGNLAFLAQYYSMLPIESDHFWNMFCRNVPPLLLNNNWRSRVYSTLLNLKVNNEKVYKRCMDMPEVQKLHDSMQADRATQHLEHQQDWLNQPLCKAVEGYLTRTGLEFVKGHFDDFYIDFAFPGKKVAVDVCVEQHFVLPALSLAGHKKAKKAILESKGWRYEVLPLLNRPTDDVVIAKAKEFFASKITQQ